MKLLMSDCSAGVGVVGYVAAIECSSVHVLRPSVSTSAGQSFGVAGMMAAAAAWLLSAFVCDVNAAKELQERQLWV
jgi:hypothetical protein